MKPYVIYIKDGKIVEVEVDAVITSDGDYVFDNWQDLEILGEVVITKEFKDRYYEVTKMLSSQPK